MKPMGTMLVKVPMRRKGNARKCVMEGRPTRRLCALCEATSRTSRSFLILSA